jgi:hypothetical protein
MADTQNQIYAQAYGSNIMQLAQQKYSKLMNTVYMRPSVRGKTFFQDQIGQWSLETKGGRNAQTPNNDPVLGRRMGIMVDYHDNRLLDRGDELKAISDPRSAYTIAAAQSIGRKLDDVILSAAVGTAYSGETGSTSVTNGNIVLVTVASLTMARLLAVKKAFDDKDVEMEDRYFVANTNLMANLLDLTEATSADYTSIKALVRGEIDTWLGFKWITSTRVPSGNLGIAYQKYGICLAMADQPLVRTDERSDLSYSWQVYYELNIGATRLEEDRVVIVNEG